MEIHQTIVKACELLEKQISNATKSSWLKHENIDGTYRLQPARSTGTINQPIPMIAWEIGANNAMLIQTLKESAPHVLVFLQLVKLAIETDLPLKNHAEIAVPIAQAIIRAGDSADNCDRTERAKS